MELQYNVILSLVLTNNQHKYICTLTQNFFKTALQYKMDSHKNWLWHVSFKERGYEKGGFVTIGMI